VKTCPDDFDPGCSCYPLALEPSEDCYVHGYPDPRRCPNCGQFRGYKPCKRCGCKYHLPKEATIEE
jgi:hypothetical protein